MQHYIARDKEEPEDDLSQSGFFVSGKTYEEALKRARVAAKKFKMNARKIYLVEVVDNKI